ncbi:MAG: glycosyltransferase 87 family protein [Chloroflexota bacterium]|nr:glycosyltransferase 87 family protein [Chloroflexota bacterium]
MIKAAERLARAALQAWRELSLDAKVISAVGTANWLLLFGNHTTVAATSDVPLWQLFPLGADLLFLTACGVLPIAYAMRDHRWGAAFTPRQRAIHLAAIVAVFVVLPTLASIVLRETGKPYTYIHDGALMIEWAARKFLLGQNPYVADYLDTPLYYWPMVNNPALYHLTYFPFLFLITTPFVWLFDKVGLFWDQRYLYLPAYVAALVVVSLLARRVDNRLALVALVALNPQLFPFVVEGRNDFFVLLFLFAGIVLLQRERRTLGPLAIAIAAAAKLHAVFIMPLVAVWLLATRRPRTLREAWNALWRPLWPATLFLAITFLPFLINDFAAFYDDVVRYNAGGAAWTYPISGMGFSAILLALGVIEFRQADFPFAAIEIAVATPIALWWMWKLWKRPTLATLLTGYALTLLAFLFFGRYFQGNYLGYILAVATPVLFLRAEAAPAKKRVTRSRSARARRESVAAAAPFAIPAGMPASTDIRTPEPVGEPIAAPAPAAVLD